MHKNAWFFKNRTVWGILGIMLVFGMVATGCPNPESSDPTTYTVSFNTDGGSEVSSRTVEEGEKVSKPADPTKTGYTFAGWYKDAAKTTLWNFDADVVTANTTLYAKWTEEKVSSHTVTFDADGGSPTTQTVAVNDGGSVGSSNMPTEPTKSGYTFDGWYTQQNSGGIEFTADTRVNGTITLYARWTIVQYTVTFDADGGSPTAQMVAVNNGGSVGSSKMPTEPTKSGCTFNGWYTQQNSGGVQFTADTTISENTTVYARWLPLVSVQIQLRPTQDDPLLSDISWFVNEDAQFSAGTGYDSYTWYWDDEAINGADSSTYTLAANAKSPGIYELLVVVSTSTGEILSARCQVTLKAN